MALKEIGQMSAKVWRTEEEGHPQRPGELLLDGEKAEEQTGALVRSPGPIKKEPEEETSVGRGGISHLLAQFSNVHSS